MTARQGEQQCYCKGILNKEKPNLKATRVTFQLTSLGTHASSVPQFREAHSQFHTPPLRPYFSSAY